MASLYDNFDFFFFCRQLLFLQYLLLFLISACKEPYREYFIGKWTSSDYETELYIKSDSSFIAKNFIINTVDDKTKRIDGKGIWRVIKFSKTFRLELIFYEPEIDCNIYFDHRDSTYKKQLHGEENISHRP